MIKVLLVNGQSLFNEAIESLFTHVEDITIIGKATTAEDAMEQIQMNTPDVVLLGAHMCNINEIKLTAAIKKTYPSVKVILLSNSANRLLIISSISSGADGFLLQDIGMDSLLQSIKNAHHDQVVISGKPAMILAKAIAEIKYHPYEVLKWKLENNNIYLSHRELEIALLMLDQKTEIEISEKLYVTEEILSQYIDVMYDKLSVNTPKEATKYLEKFTVL